MGLLADFLEPVIQNLNRNPRPMGAQETEIHRAGTGAAMVVTAALWAALPSLSPAFRSQVARMVEHGSVPQAAWIAAGVWALFLIAGALLFFAGLARSRGERDIVVAAKALCWAVAAGALLWFRAFVSNNLLLNLGLLTLYVWTLAGALTRLALALRGMSAVRLPDPEDIPDLPMSGPASRGQARDGMTGERDWVPPRFRR